MRKEFAKQLCKLLRNNNITAGNIKGNGTTEPNDSGKYSAYFTWETHDKEGGYKPLYLNFKESAGDKIKEVLDRARIPYWWDGYHGSCFKLLPMEIIICKECKKSTQGTYYNICKECVAKAHLHKKLWRDYKDCTTKDKKGACDDPKCPIHGKSI